MGCPEDDWTGIDFYDVGPDVERFLTPSVRADIESVGGSYILVQNFFEELKELVGN